MNKLAKIRMNRIRLDACPCHSFESEDVEFGLGQKVRCRMCGGSMSLIEASQYVRGYEAAGGDPCQVWAGWRSPGSMESETRCPECLGSNESINCNVCQGKGWVNMSTARAHLKE